MGRPVMASSLPGAALVRSAHVVGGVLLLNEGGCVEVGRGGISAFHVGHCHLRGEARLHGPWFCISVIFWASAALRRLSCWTSLLVALVPSSWLAVRLVLAAEFCVRAAR